MSNGNAHRRVGAVTGAIAGGVLARHQRPNDAAVEIFGALIGGWLGGQIPDLIDPPVSPSHRSIGHGLLTSCSLTGQCISNLPAWQSYLREKAGISARNGDPLAESFYLLISGILAGIVYGTASHLAMDSMTPKGLPLIA